MYRCAQCQREVGQMGDCPGCGSSDLRRVMDWVPEGRPQRRRRLPLVAIMLALVALGFLAHLEIAEYGRRAALQGSVEGQRLAKERHAQRRAVLESNYQNRLAMAMGGRSGGTGQTCGAHMNHLIEALRLYSNEHQGQYPQTLGELVPDYIDRLPSCPSAGQDSYSAGYSRSADGLEFDLACHGDNHHEEFVWTEKPTQDMPRYNSMRGWEESTYYP